MNTVDSAIAQLLFRNGMGGCGAMHGCCGRGLSGAPMTKVSSNPVGGSGSGSGSRRSSGGNAQAAMNIFGGLTEAATSITTAAIQARAARRAPAAESAALDAGSPLGGASVSTPWGKIAIGGIAGVVLIGGIFYFLSQRNKATQAPAA